MSVFVRLRVRCKDMPAALAHIAVVEQFTTLENKTPPTDHAELQKYYQLWNTLYNSKDALFATACTQHPEYSAIWLELYYGFS